MLLLQQLLTARQELVACDTVVDCTGGRMALLSADWRHPEQPAVPARTCPWHSNGRASLEQHQRVGQPKSSTITLSQKLRVLLLRCVLHYLGHLVESLLQLKEEHLSGCMVLEPSTEGGALRRHLGWPLKTRCWTRWCDPSCSPGVQSRPPTYDQQAACARAYRHPLPLAATSAAYLHGMRLCSAPALAGTVCPSWLDLMGEMHRIREGAQVAQLEPRRHYRFLCRSLSWHVASLGLALRHRMPPASEAEGLHGWPRLPRGMNATAGA